MVKLRSITLICFIAALTACSRYPEAPECQVEPSVMDTNRGNAGCVIPGEKRWQIVTTTHNETGKLDIPGGSWERDETAQCTAHRETWEETGLNVQVGPLLKKLDNGFHIYLCTMSEPFPYTDEQKELPEWVQIEIAEVMLTDLNTTHAGNWRYPFEVSLIKQLLNKHTAVK